MEERAIQNAIDRYTQLWSVEEREHQLHKAVDAYEDLCHTLGISPTLQHNTLEEKKLADSQLETKLSMLTNALLLSKGMPSPYITTLNTEIASLYVKQTELFRRLLVEKAIEIAADDLVRATEYSYVFNTVASHESQLKKIRDTDLKYIQAMIVLLYIVVLWMLTHW